MNAHVRNDNYKEGEDFIGTRAEGRKEVGNALRRRELVLQK
jgi:hypothetical protein